MFGWFNADAARASHVKARARWDLFWQPLPAGISAQRGGPAGCLPPCTQHPCRRRQSALARDNERQFYRSSEIAAIIAGPANAIIMLPFPFVGGSMPRLGWLLFACALLGFACNRTPHADVVIRNGAIYTANPQQPKVEAVAASAGKIVFAGSSREVAAYVGPDTKLIDLGGGTAVPGFTDSHYHLPGVGARERNLNLESTKNTNLEDFLAKVKAAVAGHRPGEWVAGRGWIESEWPNPVFPTRWDLDKVSPDNPVFLVRADGHGAVANSAALKIAGITRTTKNPAGGEIMRDPKTGEPNGMILDKAKSLIEDKISRTA